MARAAAIHEQTAEYCAHAKVLDLDRCFLLLIGLALVVAVGLCQNKDSAWWSAWGQWFGGAGSTGAAVAALWIAVTGWKRADQERKERALILPRLITSEYHRGQHMWGIRINNGSGGTISDVRILNVAGAHPAEARWTEALRLGDIATKVIGDHKSCFIPAELEVEDADWDAVEFAHAVVITIQFIDPDGVTWERVGNNNEPRRPMTTDAD